MSRIKISLKIRSKLNCKSKKIHILFRKKKTVKSIKGKQKRNNSHLNVEIKNEWLCLYFWSGAQSCNINTKEIKKGVGRCVDIMNVQVTKEEVRFWMGTHPVPEVFTYASVVISFTTCTLYKVQQHWQGVVSLSRKTNLQYTAHLPVHHDEAGPFSDSHLDTLQHR